MLQYLVTGRPAKAGRSSAFLWPFYRLFITQYSRNTMRAALKLFGFVVVFGLLYVCASFLTGGMTSVSARVEATLFPNKAEMAAAANAVAAEASSTAQH